MFLLFLMVIVNMPVSSILAGCPDLCICRWSAGKESVSCTNMKFKRIPQNIDGGTQLLNLTDNNISVLKNEEFNRLGLVNLQKIYLAKCRLQTIEVNAFKNLINLVELDLSFNKLTSVPSDSFQSISELRELKLSGNPIQAIFQLAFAKVPQLYRLEMTECRVANIDPLAFISLEEKLEWLKLDSNNLINVNAAVFSNLRNLHGLELANNPWNCSCSLRDLREWMQKKNVPYDIPPVCHYPERLKEKSWKILTLNDFACSPKIFANANKIRGTEGKNVTLSCNIEGIPIPHVKWSIRGRILANITSSNKKLFLINQINNNHSSELLIHNADLQDAGIYTCTAENKAGKMDDSITLTITKKLSENFSTTTLIVSILLGITLTFLCCLLTVCFVAVRKKRILKWRSSECRREDNYEKIELKPKCHRNLNGDVGNNKEDGNLLVTISKKNGDYSVVPSGTDTDHEAEEEDENVEVTTSMTTGQIKEKVWKSDEISSANQEHSSSRDNINKIYNLTCGTYNNNEPISISTSALTLENNLQSIYTGTAYSNNNRQIIPDVIGHSTRSENSSTNDINEIFCTLPRNKRDNPRYRSTDSQCALLQESCNNSSAESFSRRFSMEQQKNSQSKSIRNYSNNKLFQQAGSMLNLQKDNLNSTPLLLDVRGLESRFIPFQQQQQQSLLSSTSNPYDYHAAQLEKFLEEYRVLQKQLTKMKETCDSICQEQMKDLSTIVAGTSNCNQGNSVSLTTPNSNCIQDSVDFKNFENELTKYLMARSPTSHKNLPPSSSSLLPE